jgi:TolA-binding protein
MSARLYLIVLLQLALSLQAFALDAEDQLQFADGLYARGMYQLATKEYERFLGEFPDSDKADIVHFRIGESYRHLGDRSAAEKEFKLVFDVYPQSKMRHKAGFRRAELFMEAGQLNSARDLFNAVINENPPADIAAAAIYYTGDILLKTGKTDEGIHTLERVRNEYSSSEFYSFALLKLAEAHKAATKPDPNRVMELYRLVAARTDSTNTAAEALFQIAELHFQQNTFDKSAEAYKQLFARYPDHSRAAEARLQAAWAAHNAGIYADALAAVEKALASHPDTEETKTGTAEWLYLKANCERQLIKNDAAAQTYSDLLEKYPDSRFADPAYFELALSLYRMGRYNDALRSAQKVKFTTPDMKRDVYWLMAESYSHLDDEENAVQYYRLLNKEFPKSELSRDATYRLAHHLQTRSEYKEASRYFNTVAANFPESDLAPQALFASGFCLATENMHKEAVRDWSLLVQKYPAHPLVEEALYQKAMSEIRLKRDEQAIATLRELAGSFPSSRFTPELHYWQAVVLKNMKKSQDAEEELRLCLKSSPRKELEREAQLQLGALLHQAGRFDQAGDLFQPLLSSPVKDKLNPELLKWLSEHRFEKGQFAESTEAASLLVERSKEPVWQETGWCMVGRGMMAQGKTDDAVKAFEKSLAAGGGTRFGAESALKLGGLSFGAGSFADARKHFDKAARLASDENMLGVRANAYAGLGRTAKAESELEKAARYFMSVAVLYDDPELVPECLYEAVQAFRTLKRSSDAVKAAKELIKRYPDSSYADKLNAGN